MTGTAVDEVLALFARPEADEWYDEAVTERQHALQAAALAADAGSSEALVAAALLHDVGHLLVGDLRVTGQAGEGDARHEQAGALHLARWFGGGVTTAIRWHVAAKRYLCATEPGYGDRLSPASTRSLMVQGGAMTPSEVADFEAMRGHSDAVTLRRFDDGAKVAGLTVPELDTYVPLLRDLVRS